MEAILVETSFMEAPSVEEIPTTKGKMHQRPSRARQASRGVRCGTLGDALLGGLIASLIGVLILVLGGCELFQPEAPQPAASPSAALSSEAAAAPPVRRRARPPLSTARRKYEGSLWRGPASWGNLLRDHRARYPGDLLTVDNVDSVINVADTPDAPSLAATLISPAQARYLEQRRQVQAEQNQILGGIRSVEVQVRRVLSSGNLLVSGTLPPIYRQGNSVRYLFTFQGVVRPSDVDADNTINAERVSRAEYGIRRFIQRRRRSPTDSNQPGRTNESGIGSRFQRYVIGDTTGSGS